MKEKIKNLQKLTEQDIQNILNKQHAELEKLLLTEPKKHAVRANEAITRQLLSNYNYKIECYEKTPDAIKKYSNSAKIALENTANSILKKMEWWND